MAEYVTKEQLINWFRPYGHIDKPIPFETLVSDLRVIKAANVVPVRHGRWIPFNESEISGFNPELAGCDPIAGYRCSKCGAEAILDCNDQFVLSKCCHDCGAKMV